MHGLRKGQGTAPTPPSPQRTRLLLPTWTRLPILALVALAVASCDKDKAPEPAPVAPPPASVAPAAASAAPAAPAASFDNSGALLPGETISSRLGLEAAHRPTIKPNADDIFAAFEKLGVTIPRKEQGLGKTYKANYCVFGPSATGTVTVTVCEYPDDAGAAVGLDLSKKIFPDMPSRQAFTHKSTLLMLLQLKQDPATADLEKKLIAAYLAM